MQVSWQKQNRNMITILIVIGFSIFVLRQWSVSILDVLHLTDRENPPTDKGAIIVCKCLYNRNVQPLRGNECLSQYQHKRSLALDSSQF